MLLAAYVKVMSGLSEARRGHVGLVSDARPERAGAERVYGMHLNTVPFAVDRTAATWRELVRRVFAQEAELWPYRRYPMPAIPRESPGDRLIRVAFNYVDLPRRDSAGDTGATITQSHTEFDLIVHCRADRINLTTRTGVLSRGNAVRLAGMYRAVLERMIDDPDGDARAPIAPYPFPDGPTTVEREPFTGDPARQLEHWAAQTPDAPAVSSDAGTTNWRALNEDVNRLAHLLSAGGVRLGTVVAVCLPASSERIVAVLAVLKAGGVCLPLDSGTPTRRLAFQLADAGARLILALGADAPKVPVPVLAVDDPRLADQPVTDPEAVAAPQDPAFLLYTSGSTGRPKGVSLTRRGVVNHLLAKVGDLSMTAADILAQNAPPTFVVAIWQLLGGTATGGCVRVVPEAVSRDPQALFDLVARERITVLEVVPSLLRAALDGGVRLPSASALRHLVVTGEALPADLVDGWFARFPEIPVLNSTGRRSVRTTSPTR